MNILIDEIDFPEGPAFDRHGNIWLVEKQAGNLIRYKAGLYERISVDGHPNGIAIAPDQTVWFCDALQNSIRRYSPTTNTCDTIANELEGKPLKMPNDLCFDTAGNLLFTCPGSELTDGTGYVCCLQTNGRLRIVYQNMYYPNGLAFAPKSNNLFIAETGSKWIWKMEWNINTRKMESPEKFAPAGGKIGPDGLAFDEAGNLLIAIYGSQHILLLNPANKTTEKLMTPGHNPTNCALDPSGELGLIVTETEKGQLLQLNYTKKGIL
ncbi:SMP-30/gluconolactonase/LRE family protein [Sphingobacterium thalpophilum]|uniref:SMP-30/gluconolactonase/LRE family protein n=1 Tax=Sphingobacterium thalpophilum TaxID=259 RepID=UPI0037D9AEA8